MFQTFLPVNLKPIRGNFSSVPHLISSHESPGQLIWPIQCKSHLLRAALQEQNADSQFQEFQKQRSHDTGRFLKIN